MEELGYLRAHKHTHNSKKRELPQSQEKLMYDRLERKKLRASLALDRRAKLIHECRVDGDGGDDEEGSHSHEL